MNTRFLAVLSLLCVVLSAAAAQAANEAPWTQETIVYKTVGPTKIEADVYRRNGTQSRPAIVWIHGGALIMGNRHGVPKDIVELARANNYVLISLDYRLAPEVKLPAIIEDVKDAFALDSRRGCDAVSSRSEENRRGWRIGGRVPDDDDRHLRRAAPDGAGGLLGIWRRRRTLVHRAVGALSAAAAR